MLHKYHQYHQRLAPPGTAPKVTQSTSTAGGKKSQRILKGYALVFNKKYWMGDHFEVISPQALKYADMSDVRCLFNHDVNYVLGRSSAGTLKLTIDEVGLYYECPLPDTHIGNHIAESLRRRDISQSSFSFRLRVDESRKYYGDYWSQTGNVTTRTIIDISAIWDVGPVTFPASPTTEAGLLIDMQLQQNKSLAKKDTPTLTKSELLKKLPSAMTDEEFEKLGMLI